MKYDKLLLDELRFVTYQKGTIELTDELLVKAVSLNENLQSLGYMLSPSDIISIATSPSMDSFDEKIKEMMDTVDAAPMYPGFPEQVMEMDEAQFRLHQLIHYFSTYGLETLLGVEVKKGWLPFDSDRSDGQQHMDEQPVILNAKVIQLLPIEESYITPLKVILTRKERMTMPEREIISEAISHISAEQIHNLKVGFKENMNVLYDIVFSLDNREQSFQILHELCQHTGDVLRCIGILLSKKKYHFRTSEKRFLVKLLESYPVNDFRANLVLSGKGAERNILLLKHLDYSVYSRSKEHMNAVNDLRDGALHSWKSIATSLLESGDAGALDFISQRPGMMLRMIAWLMRRGYTKDAILSTLLKSASSLSMQTLVTNMNYFGKCTKDERPDAEDLYFVFEQLLKERMKSCNTPFSGKKVMIKMDDFNLAVSEIHTNDKSAEGGYIRSGIAYRIPREVDRLRFFVYWNDTERVDVDLHAGFADLDGKFHMVGWNASFYNNGVVTSGDITHSDAAEYIDIDLNAPIDRLNANINLFTGRAGFDNIETCFVGMMAVPKVDRIGQTSANRIDGPSDVEDADEQHTALYSEANCFFKHNLRQHCRTMNYGYIDVKNRCLIFDGAPKSISRDWYTGVEHRRGKLSLARYLVLLMEAQNASVCSSSEEADVILVMGKHETEKEVSIIDANFFMD